MNFDFPTVMIVLFGLFTLVSGIGCIWLLMRERKAEVLNRINDVEEGFYRDHEKMWQRINGLERCCKNEYPVKNHYNTGA